MITKMKTIAATTALAAMMTLGAQSASATVMSQDYDTQGLNDCSGEFGTGFDNCVDPSGSPVIAKYDIDDTEWTINSSFTNVLSGMFTLTLTSTTVGEWSYNPCPTCVVVTSFVIKTGDGFRWYYTDPKEAIYSGSWDVSTLGDGAGISHITFYDTAPSPVPVPAAGLLLLAGIGSLVAVRRRKAQHS